MDFYSEHYEDLFCYRHGLFPEKGVYVDVGCYHPRIGSNTAFVRDLGWTGIGIDANPNMAHAWKKCSGKFVNALVGDGAPAKYEVNGPNPGWSRIGKGDVTPTRTLSSILAEHNIGKVDLLSIDLEGSEYDALKTLDFEKHQPTVIIAEYDTAEIGKDFRVLEYLIKGDYVAMHMTAANIIFRLAKKEYYAPVK